MKHYFTLALLLVLATTNAQTANDSIFFWKTGNMIHKQSIKLADMDSITFKRPAKITAIGETVVIGTQSWTTKNLNVSTYRDGTVIPQVQDAIGWAALKTGAWCYYENKTANGIIYGKLYNWYAVAGIHDNDPNTPNKTLAPAGYHIPTDAEWTILTTFLGGESVAGGKMKSTTLWQSPNTGATNSSGFTGLPGGWRGGDTFYGLGEYGLWQSATEAGTNDAVGIGLSYNNGYAGGGADPKESGFSVRCLLGEAVVSIAPTITTTTVTVIAPTTATTGGNVSNNGGAAVTARGVVYSTAINPTIALTTKTVDGSGTGTFLSSITGLTANTTYYVRAYATNSAGTAYGVVLSFKTLPAVVAPSTVTIGTQTWTTKNLDLTTYTDGTIIPQVTDPKQWASLRTGAWCYYNNDERISTILGVGKLYNWYAVAGIHDIDPNTPNKKLAPTGYHIPTDAEWTTLINFLGGTREAGNKLKSITGWSDNGIINTNSSGFTGLAGGVRYNYGTFNDLTYEGCWWSSTDSGFNAWLRNLTYFDSFATKDLKYKEDGLSVRCIKD